MKYLVHYLFVYIMLSILLAMYGMTTPEFEHMSESMSEPLPEWTPSEYDGIYGGISSAYDQIVYTIQLGAAIVGKIGMVMGMAFALSTMADRSMMGLPLFAMLNIGMLTIFLLSIIEKVKPFG